MGIDTAVRFLLNAPAQGEAPQGGFDWFTVLLLGFAAVMIFFMFRNGKKRQKMQAELQDKFVEGAEVMTGSGIFGTIYGFSPLDDNRVILETSPGQFLTVHRQALSRVIEPEEITEDEIESSTDDENSNS